ncbi:polymorphic outer membrane protein [Candidatus Vecturithrix granuli]|uniref:Polymorphic outer membrane protein n=1 Tax=Vecturithrix granuli TaxID=1499967 RepID=A0A081BUP9_VECG1|nr:polymorphic outer membrane protein [Candidatus Vecturithrix granuli]
MKKVSVLIIMIALFMLPAWNTYAATIIVNTTDDELNSDGDCSLREAVQSINTATNVDGCSATGSYGTDDTITLQTETYTLTIAGANEDNNATGDLDIRSSLTINGVDASKTIIQGGTAGPPTPNGIDRVFHIPVAGIMVNISNVTIRNGNAPGITTGRGGGIFVAVNATLSLNNSVVSNNTANVNNGGDNGGGGGLENNGGAVTINNCTFSNNVAVRNGGGIYTRNGTLMVTNSTISGNSGASYAGGIYQRQGGIVTLTNTTISGNISTAAGAGDGGGIFAYSDTTGPTITLNNCTVSNNTANQGGGISRWRAGLTPAGVNITPSLTNTILADNIAPTNPDCYTNNLTSGGYNLIETAAGCGTINGDTTTNILGSDPNLAALTDNGGPTPTHALLTTPTISPAIDKIPFGTSGCGMTYTTDQRGTGYSRPSPAGGACDIGAYEYQSVTTYILTVTTSGNGTVTSTPAGIDCGADCSESYVSGTAVSLSATADTGWTFSAWSGDCDASGNVTMDAAKTCTATFVLASFSVLIDVTPGTTVATWDLLTFTPVASGGTLAAVTWKFGDCYAPPCGASAVQSESTITSAPFTETFRYPKAGTYVVTLEATDTLNNTATASVTITVTGSTPSLTLATQNLGNNLTAGSPISGDLNGDGVKEVVVPSDHSIRVVGGVNMALGPATGICGSSPLLAKDDAIGAINGIFALDTTGRLYGWTAGGASLTGYPLTVTEIKNVSPMASPAIGDIDGDGDLDIAWGGDGDTNGEAYVTAHDIVTGDPLGGFPVLLSNNVGTGPTYPRTTSVALANVIGGTGREIFIGYNNVSTNTGNVMRVAAGGATLNFSMNANEQIGSGGIPSTQYANSGPTVGDVDNDRTMELVLGGDQGHVYIWNASTGALEAVVDAGTAPITSDPTLAYLTSDTGLDIVVANAEGTVFCIRWNGTISQILWQTDLGTLGLLSPVIADVDGDNALEVVISKMRSGRVFVLERDGSINTGISAATGTAGQINASAAVSDLDRDADYEILVTDDVASPAQDKLYIWDIPKTLPTANLRTIVGWPFLRGNYYRDGSITTANLYPVKVTYDTIAWPLMKFWVHVENRGTGIANNVALKYVSYQPFMSLVSPANGIIMITPNPPASIAAGATGVTEPLTFNMSAYAGQEIIMYFDITYTDADGTEHLIHR